ncbi:MAG: EI24 domain-containing protein [Kofleriaceae bacterium]
MTDLGRGAGDLARGLRYMNQHKRLWGWVIAPAIVTLVLMVGVVFAVLHLAAPLVDGATSWMPSFLQGIAGALVSIIVFVALGFGALLVFVSVVGMIAGPFNELLSEAIEEQVTGKPGPKFSLGGFFRGAAIGIGHGMRRLAITLVAFVLLFILGFIPVIGTIAATAIGVWLAARGAAYDCYDAVLSRRELAYRDKQAYLAANRKRAMGLGLGVVGMLFVPGVNLLALGLGTAGATLATLESTSAPRGRTSRRPD